MSPSLPTDFNQTGPLIDYVKELGITVGVGFLVPALVLSLILIIVFVKFCGGGSEKREEFNAKPRIVLSAIAIFVMLLAVASCAVGWSYNSQCHEGVQHGSVTLQGVITSSAQVMLAVNSTVSNFTGQLVDQVNQTEPVVANITALLVPLNGVLGVVGDAELAIQNLTALTIVIANNITAVKTDLVNLQDMQAEGIISGVPPVSDVPDINDEFTNTLNSSQASLNSVTDTVYSLADNANTTLITVSNTVQEQLITQTNEYTQKADSAISDFMGFYSHITDTNTTFNRYAPHVIHYSSIRKSVVAGILVLPISLSALSLVGVLLRIKLVLKISAAFCFFFMFWYFLLAGINYAGYYTLQQFCQKQELIVGNALSVSDSTITIPGTNVTVLVSEKVELLLKCAGNNTLIDIFEFNFLFDDLNDEIQTQLNSINTQAQQLNQSAQYQLALSELNQMENDSVNLNFLQNSSLPTVHSDLSSIAQELNATINNPEYFSSLDAVNNITNNLILPNGSIYHLYYDSSNITTLNCTVDPFDKMNANAQEDLCTKSETAIALTLVRNKALSRADAIYGNITDINDRLYGFESSLPTIAYYQNETLVWANRIRYYLNDANNIALALIGQIAGVALSLAQLIVAGVQAMKANTECAYVGNAYTALTKNLCTDVRHPLEVISAMMVVGAAVFFISTITSMVAVYKIDRGGNQLD